MVKGMDNPVYIDWTHAASATVSVRIRTRTNKKKEEKKEKGLKDLGRKY